ncbi:MAG TPA: alpha/beta hydrolase fold domain-containing protein [Vicinamibacterales bacterium]|nr:alpha/beta hydrolase fold domain-containing protein [Vicinamibacterales bacterium]
MYTTARALLIAGLSLTAVAPPASAQRQGQVPPPPNPTGPYTVTLVPPVHGKVALNPALPADGKYAKGTVVTVTATPDSGYALDSVWYSVPGRFGQMYHEGMTRDWKVTIDQDKRIGASFIEEAAVKDLVVTNDVVFAKPGVKTLKYDVFAPKGARNLPMIVIIHGGGWQANDEDIMRGLARELTKGGKFVVASMDYRWGGKEDGDATSNTMADLIDDVFGGIAHIMEHAAQYGGDPTRVGVTGDSAGGHLAAVASLMPNMIGSRGFGKTAGVFEYMPSYMPKGKTVEQVRDEMMKAIKAGAPSYGVFGPAMLNPYSEEHGDDPAWKEAVAPLLHIPPATERSVPQFLTRGTQDPLIKDEMVKEFTDALVKAGQRAEYVQVGGASHAFFDWKPDDRTKATFAKYGVYYAARMREFFESVLY